MAANGSARPEKRDIYLGRYKMDSEYRMDSKWAKPRKLSIRSSGNGMPGRRAFDKLLWLIIGEIDRVVKKTGSLISKHGHRGTMDAQSSAPALCQVWSISI